MLWSPIPRFTVSDSKPVPSSRTSNQASPEPATLVRQGPTAGRRPGGGHDPGIG